MHFVCKVYVCIYYVRFRVILKFASDVFLRFGKHMATISSYIAIDTFYLFYLSGTSITHMLNLLTGFHMPHVLIQAHIAVGKVYSFWL